MVLFYLVVLGDPALSGERAGSDKAAAWHEWVLLLFPLFLLPYLFSLIRTLRRADELILDGREKIVCKGRRTLAAFADIRSLELQTVHGSCEEFRLSAILSNGQKIELVETEASVSIEVLAHEISKLLDVPLAPSA